MRKYLLISKKMEGFVVYGYDKQGYLVEFRNCCWGMTHEQRVHLLEGLSFALHFSTLKKWLADTGGQLIPVENDLSFDRFWNEYDYARNKDVAKPFWDKLSEEERQYTLYSLEAYNRYCKRFPWYTKMLASTFLQHNRKDDWDKVPEPVKNNKQ